MILAWIISHLEGDGIRVHCRGDDRDGVVVVVVVVGEVVVVSIVLIFVSVFLLILLRLRLPAILGGHLAQLRPEEGFYEDQRDDELNQVADVSNCRRDKALWPDVVVGKEEEDVYHTEEAERLVERLQEE